MMSDGTRVLWIILGHGVINLTIRCHSSGQHYQLSPSSPVHHLWHKSVRLPSPTEQCMFKHRSLNCFQHLQSSPYISILNYLQFFLGIQTVFMHNSFSFSAMRGLLCVKYKCFPHANLRTVHKYDFIPARSLQLWLYL